MSESKGFDLGKFKPLFNEERKNLIAMAKLAENSERYEDMCKIMRALVEYSGKPTTPIADKGDLSVEERNLLSVAYKNVVGARRASWRTLNVDEHKDDPIVKLYRKQVETELERVCKDVLDLLQNVLLKNYTEENESRVFYLKMTADYYRYLAEFNVANNGTADYDKKAAEFYQKAMDIANVKLQPTNAIRLGLALNYSVCLYEILKESKKACELAKTAFDEAISKIDNKFEDGTYKDSTLIMQLIRDNLTSWTSSHDEAGDVENADS